MKPIYALAVMIAIVFCTALAFGETGAIQTKIEKLQTDPSRLRHMSRSHEFRGVDPAMYEPTMKSIALNPDLDWDLRARALTFLGPTKHQDVLQKFAKQFEPVGVAATDHGAEAFNILSEWLTHSFESQEPIVARLLPGPEMSGVAEILRALAGESVHEYLHLLYRRNYPFQPAEIKVLAETDDQLCRQFLNWYVGHQHLEGMENFLVGQIGSPRTNSYGSKVDRVLLAVLTAGIGELIRSAIPVPEWLEDEATPKGLALQSLGTLIPVGSQFPDRALIDDLLRAAKNNSTGKKRGQWQIAIDILILLDQRGFDLSDRADPVVNNLVRLAIRKRGPLVPFVEIERLHRESGLPLPALSDEEKTKLWDVAFTTLDADFLSGVIRTCPNEKREKELREHLLGLGEQAVRGNLSMVRCWGADIERTDDWVRTVAELDITEAVPSIEIILVEWHWIDESIEALVHFGPAGAPVLDRYLRTPAADRLDTAHTIDAIRACRKHLPEADWASLLLHLRTRQYLSEAAERVQGANTLVRPMTKQGAS